MNNQDIFNKVARHLLDQNMQAMNISESGSITCMYRNKDGLRCAIGCLIPDEDYDYSLEGMGIRASFMEELPLWNIFHSLGYRSDNLALMSDLQACHDEHDPVNWPDELYAIAKNHKLEVPDFLKIQRVIDDHEERTNEA